MNLIPLFIALIVFVAILLILVVMVQNPKEGGLSSSFGGNTQIVGGVQNTNKFLDKSTWTLATILVLLILLSNTVIKGVDAPPSIEEDDTIKPALESTLDTDISEESAIQNEETENPTTDPKETKE